MKVLLAIFKEDGSRKDFSIDPGQTIIGRREDCGLRIPLSEVSRRHAVLTVTDSAVRVRDLGSANGTYINNQRVTEQDLAAGDHIVIGPVVFTVQIDGEPEDLRPVRTRLEARTPAGRMSSAAASVTAANEDPANQDEEDPISALEALASSDETSSFDLDDSFPDLDVDDPK